MSPTLKAGTHVFREDIEAWEKQAGVKVGPGDALLLRVGRPATRTRGGRGYDASFLPFLKDRDVAIMGGDAADVGVIQGCTNTGPVPTMCWNAIHKFVLVARGMHLFDGLDMEAVAATAGQAEALGVHVRGRADSCAWRVRCADQSRGDFLDPAPDQKLALNTMTCSRHSRRADPIAVRRIRSAMENAGRPGLPQSPLPWRCPPGVQRVILIPE